MNCLEYALLFWQANPYYQIWYNGDHCINSSHPIESRDTTMPYRPLTWWPKQDIKRQFGFLGKEVMKMVDAYYDTAKTL